MVPCRCRVVEDPKAWFRLCDADGDRKLSRDEVVSALKAQLPLDNRAIDRFRTDDAAWRLWDADQCLVCRHGKYYHALQLQFG